MLLFCFVFLIGSDLVLSDSVLEGVAAECKVGSLPLPELAHFASQG